MNANIRIAQLMGENARLRAEKEQLEDAVVEIAEMLAEQEEAMVELAEIMEEE